MRPSAPVGSPVGQPQLFKSAAEKNQLEVRNGLLQFDEVKKLAHEAAGTLALAPDLIKNLQRIAIQDIYACAGNFRDWPVCIHGSPHQPPDATEVPGLVQEMCDYANGSTSQTPIHTAAYLLWRLNWIHPFGGGNGRTSRAVSYLAMCVRLGFVLPGAPAIPELIGANRQPYYDALDLADASWKTGQIDVSAMEKFLSDMLAAQLLGIHHAATGSFQPSGS